MTVSSILAGITSSGLTVGPGETLQVAGTLFATTVASGGSAYVSAGGSGSGLTIGGGGLDIVLSGGTVSSSIVQNGGLETVSGGIAVAATVESGGGQFLTAGGIASATTIDSAGIQYVSGGSAYAAVLMSGAVQYVGQGGLASGTVLSGSGTYAFVLSGGTASAMTVDSAGNAYVAGGTAAGITVNDGGSAVVVAGGSASGIVLRAGGTAFVSLTGIADATTVEAGGFLGVGDGTIRAAVLQAGASGTVTTGGTASATTVSGSAAHLLLSGGVALSTTVAGGGTLLEQGGAATTATQVSAGGSDLVQQGTATAATVTTGGTLLVASGGTAVAAQISAGGVAVISAGGIASSVGVAGGQLVLAAGAVVGGGLLFQSGSVGGDIVISGTTLPIAPISGFASGDTIELPDIPYDPNGSIGLSGTVLSFTENGHGYTLSLAGGSVSAGLQADGSGSEIVVACYAAGTAVATPSGPAPVERLRPGDLVLAWRDGAWAPRPVRWVGHTRVDLRRHPQPGRAAPVRIRRDAIAAGVPGRDLCVSPDHAICLDGLLFQAQALANGATVVQERPDAVTYWHVELDRHALLLAEGLPAETYLDTGNRALFAGERGARALHPDLAMPSAEALRIWDAQGCAPLRLAGDAVRAAHARLLARAHELGGRLAADPELQVLGTGRDLPVQRLGAFAWHVPLPAGTQRLRLVSRHFVPDWLGRSADDRRRLGIAVSRLRLNGAPLGEAAFGTGWYAPETAWRWTDGDAALRLWPLQRPGLLAVSAAPMGPVYWEGPWNEDRDRDRGGAVAGAAAVLSGGR